MFPEAVQEIESTHADVVICDVANLINDAIMTGRLHPRHDCKEIVALLDELVLADHQNHQMDDWGISKCSSS